MNVSSTPPSAVPADESAAAVLPVPRIKIEALLQGGQAIEIEHNGRIYRLQLNRANKLLLTA